MKSPFPIQNISYNNSFVITTRAGGLIGIGFELGFSIYYQLIGYPIQAVGLNLLAVFFSLIGLILIQFFHRPRLAAYLVMSGIYTSLFGPGVFTGGIDSSSMVWLFIIPLAAALMAGDKAGLIWSIITVLSLVGLFIFNRVLMIDYTIHPTESIDRLIDLVCAMSIMMIAIWLNETIKKRVMNQLEQEISERKEVENEVRSLNEALETHVKERTAQLEQANQELASLSYSMAHSLRTPIRALDGFSYVLLEEYNHILDETGKDYLNRIRRASRHIWQMTDDLIELLSITHKELKLSRVDLSSMSQQIMQGLKNTQPERQVEFTCPEGFSIEADPELTQVLMDNLLGNAWKFTRECPLAQIELGSLVQEGQPVFFVRDNGAGIDMAYYDKLFGVFQRLHAPNEFEGRGVGLAIVQRILQRHGGRIWADGAVNQGATFFFTMRDA
jgi:signal transduction histidine kinase